MSQPHCPGCALPGRVGAVLLDGVHYRRAMESTTLTRRELFDLVWSTPIRKLAARYGLSDVALRKKCVKHDIPVPGIGHWAKVAAGHRVPLPQFPPNSKAGDRIVLQRWPRADSVNTAPEVPMVAVPERLGQTHDAIRFLRTTLEGSETDKHGRLTGGHAWLHCVTPKCLPRLLRLLQALFQGLEARGHRVEVARAERAQHHSVSIIIDEEGLSLHVEEKLRKKERALATDEKRWNQREAEYRQEMGRPPRKPTRRWVQIPTGELYLRTNSYWQYRGPSSWMDRRWEKLEDQLGQVVVGLEAVAAFNREMKIEEAKAAQERLVAERKQLRANRMDVYLRYLADDLRRMTADWVTSRDMLGFLHECSDGLPNNPEAQDWLVSATAYAEKLNPLSNVAEVWKTLQPTDEKLEQIVGALQARK